MVGKPLARPDFPPSLRTWDGRCTGKIWNPSLKIIFKTIFYFRVPETATVLLGGGVNFAELPEYAQFEFQVQNFSTSKAEHLVFPFQIKNPTTYLRTQRYCYRKTCCGRWSRLRTHSSLWRRRASVTALSFVTGGPWMLQHLLPRKSGRRSYQEISVMKLTSGKQKQINK